MTMRKRKKKTKIIIALCNIGLFSVYFLLNLRSKKKQKHLEYQQNVVQFHKKT